METSTPDHRNDDHARIGGSDRVTVVLRTEEGSRRRDEITLSEVRSILRQERWLVLSIIILAVVGSVAYALLAPQWYRAEVVLVPVKQNTSGLGGDLGGLGTVASVIGVDIGKDDTAEPIAVLKSHEFTAAFIQEQHLLPTLFSRKWDAKARKWTAKDPEDWPDLRDGVKYFDEHVRSMDEDKRSGLITLAIEWKNPVLAADWANLLVDRLNARMRERAIVEAQSSIDYLEVELEKSSVVTVQQAIARVLEGQMQKMMLARSSSEYSFRSVDRADAPKWRERPHRVQVVIIGTLIGVALAVVAALYRHSSRQRSA